MCDTCTSTATAARGSGNSYLNSSAEQRLLKALQLVLAGRILQSEGMATDIGCNVAVGDASGRGGKSALHV